MLRDSAFFIFLEYLSSSFRWIVKNHYGDYLRTRWQILRVYPHVKFSNNRFFVIKYYGSKTFQEYTLGAKKIVKKKFVTLLFFSCVRHDLEKLTDPF